MSRLLVLKPILSEKAYALSEQRNTYVFNIPAEFNRHIISKAVAEQFKVGVKSVRTSKLPEKSRRSYNRQSRKFKNYTTPAMKKAYVTLNEGDKLPFFAAADDSKEKQ